MGAAASEGMSLWRINAIKQYQKITCPAVSWRRIGAGIPYTRLNNFHNSRKNPIGSCLVLKSQNSIPHPKK
jgi:hypothetical protein